MMRIASISKRVLLTGMVVSTMFTAAASPMLVAQAASSDDDMEVMGLVESMPDGGTVGSWVIGGETFNADENTDFDTNESPLAVGACAEVEYEASADGNLALKIEGDDSPDCTDTEKDEESEDSEDEKSMELMGLVESMPDGGTVGSWVIGGETFIANESTEINADKSPLEVGACAEVEYEAAADGNLALKIEGDDSPDCTDSDERDETEDTEDADSTDADGEDVDAPEEPGTVDSGTPPNAESGNAVDTGSAPLRLMSNMIEAAPDQAPHVGNGTEDPNAPEDEDTENADDTEDDDGAEDEEEEEETHGIVDAMPAGADTPMGTWVIDGVNYVATADTEVEEEHGLLEIGAYVGLEFQVIDGVNQLVELETEPAPGEGPNTTAGMIESTGGGVVAANFTTNIQTSATASSTWVIGGTEYTIVSTTELDEQQGALSVGSLAQVNSYTDVNGNEVATLISGMEMPVQTEFMFLPIVLQHG